MPLILNLPTPELITVKYADLGDLVIPPEYQREEIKPWVYKLANVLRQGGTCPPVSLNDRPNGPRVIVDGQQRTWAHIQATVDMHALLYKLPEPILDNEKAMYQILNIHVLQTGDNIVNSYPGVVAGIVRHWINLKGSPYHGNTSLGRRGSRPYSAAILARSVCCVISSAGTARGGIRTVLDRGDMCISNGHAADLRERSEAILRLLPLVFPPDDRIRMEPALAVADVARERWAHGLTGKFPKPTEQQRLRAINWALLAPGYHTRFFPSLRTAVADRWRTGA